MKKKIVSKIKPELKLTVEPKLKSKMKKGGERVSLGISGFDKLIKGGFEKGSTNLIVGGSGSGKTILGVQFLLEGIRKGENVLFITFEEKKCEFYQNMKNFGWDLEKFEKQGKFTFLEYTPEKVRTMLEEGGGIIESIVLRKKITRLVIDSITSFELLFEEEIKKRGAALKLFGMLRKWDVTSFLTYEGDPFREKQTSSRALEFESDSIILIYFIRPKGKKQRQRFMEVLKMRGSEHATEIYPLTISKNGVVVGTSPISEDLGF